MILAFIIASVLVGIVASLFWTTSGGANAFIKVCMVLYTAWAFIMLLAWVFSNTPLVNNAAAWSL